MTTTRVSEFEKAYKIESVSEFGLGLGRGYGVGYGLGYGFGYGLEHGRGYGRGSLDSKKDLIDDDDARV